MTKIYTSADQLIGNTPLLELTSLEKKLDLKTVDICEIIAKYAIITKTSYRR